MDNVYYVISVKGFFTKVPVALCSTRERAREEADRLEEETGKVHVIDRVELIG